MSVVYSLCDLTGNMVRPWAEAGHDCVCVDTQHPQRSDRVERAGAGIITYRWGDVRSLTPDDLPTSVIVFAFPPCTDLSRSGAQDWPRKGLRRLIDALEVVEACRLLCAFSGAPWMLENPSGRLSTCWRKPDHTFHPWQYGDPWSKLTCLWTGGGFVMPPVTAPVAPDPTAGPHYMAPGPDRANRRSATPAGFARAVIEANAPRVRQVRVA